MNGNVFFCSNVIFTFYSLNFIAVEAADKQEMSTLLQKVASSMGGTNVHANDKYATKAETGEEAADVLPACVSVCSSFETFKFSPLSSCEQPAAEMVRVQSDWCYLIRIQS